MGGSVSDSVTWIASSAGFRLIGSPLRRKTARALVESIGQVGSVLTNPVDMSQRQAVAAAVRQALALVADEPQIDLILVYENSGLLLDVYPREVTNSVNQAFLDFNLKGKKPLVLVLPPGPAESRRREIEEAFKGAGVPVFPNVERVAKAVRNTRLCAGM